jgi:DNA-binding transcriptional LysR family regulator
MELAELKSFVQIVERGSLSAASRAMRQGLSTTSRHLTALEEDVGTTLALRTTRKLVVTDAGRRFYDHARRALDEIERATNHQALDTPLVVSCGITIGQHLVMPRLTELLRARSDLRIELRLEDRVAELLTENIDVVVRAGVLLPDSTELVAHTLTSFPRVVVAAPSYLTKYGRPQTPRALVGHTCVIQASAAGPIDRWRLRSGGATTRTVGVTGRFSSNAPQLLLDAAKAGLGIALLPSWLVAGAIGDGTLDRLLPSWRTDAVTMSAVYRRRLRGSPAIQALVGALGDGR